ncbi:cache domain-containing protein [Sulfurimonas sp.]
MKIVDKITPKINLIIVLFSFVVLFISFYFVYTLSISYAQKETVQSLDTTLQLTKNLLEEEEQHALSLSLLLSQDKAFLETFYKQDRAASFEIIKQKIDALKKLQGYSFDVQVHDKNLHTYLRSWDFSVQDVPLAAFRQGLVKVKELKKPLVSVEVGRRLNIKAISPILKNNKFEGSIEVIENFEHLRKKLAEQGYALFVLLNKKYITIATTLKHHSLIADKFVVVNDSYDTNSFMALKNMNLNNLQSYGYLMQGKFSFGYFDIKNFKNEELGYIMIAMKNSMSLSTRIYHEKISKESNSSEVIIR